ncbi:MAG TPA: enoyl-CoA hydratase/isomerase family protein [Paracoccaceae bacterium]|nr:enoyl-CoA hydratase/isomerase family protein [Paracoccaceae bacterium]
MSDIDIRVEGRVGRITLTRPQALNALSWDMALAMERALDAWREDPAIAMVLVDAEGERAFCAGGDLQLLYESGRSGDFGYGRRFWADEYRLNARIARFPKPYVALMQGFVMGGGVGISGHGSHRIVTGTTQIAMPECGIGLIPDVGGTWLLGHAPGRLGEYLGLTGARMGPADAILAGFADAFVPAERFPALREALLTDPLPDAVLPAFVTEPPAGSLAPRRAGIDAVFAGSLDDIRRAADPEAQKAIARACPLSLACTLELVRRARGLARIEDALAEEYRFTARSMSEGEFLEGIRAQVIDKDRNPRWQVAATPETVAAMLAPLGEMELRL